MIKRFLLLNGLATIGVVLNHAAGHGYTALFWWADRYLPVAAVPDFSQATSLNYFGLRTIEQLVAFSVAAFLVVSGFFIAFAARGKSLSWQTVRSRIWYLLVPYLLWSLAIFAFEFVQGMEFTVTQILLRLLTGRGTSGYYYVPMLIQMFLLAPLLVRLAQRSWRLLLAMTGMLLLIIQAALYLESFGVAVPGWLMFWTQSWLFPGNLLWFALGIVIGFNLKPFKAWIDQTRRVWLITAIILIPLGLLEWQMIQRVVGEPFLQSRMTLLDSLYAMAVIFAFLAYERAKPPQSQQLSDLGTKSYGVYLANSPVLDLASRLIAVLVPALLAYQFLMQPILWVVGLGIPLLLMALVGANRSPVRAYYKYIFG